ncbi:hypothetical protein AALP_AA6G275900 [Arabis alpina]|uniref:Phytocyanin domain-containing protein n=1 Tax=Arabis alpina TaxID=50452 RepID=A0A087GS35_ARAAL|nr:hypothetical protein AALP_AA6G275900 [Arabis alpina]
MASLISILPIIFILFTTLNHLSEARIFVVGGLVDAWKVPEPSNNTLNHWAEKTRFQVGDILLFSYSDRNDSVLQVTKENYDSCNTQKPLKEYKGGNNKVTLDVSGPHYFISGAPTGNCGKGEKLEVVVASSNHPPMPKPAPGAAPPTPSSKPGPGPAAPTPSSKPHTSTAPAPAPSNTAAGLVAGNGIFWASVLAALFGLAWA